MAHWSKRGKRSLSVVQTTHIPRPSTKEPHVSESPRVRVGGSLPNRRTRGNVGSGFRHCHALVRETDDSSERTTERGCDGHCTRPGKITTDPTIPNLDFLDDVGLEESFAERVPMLKSWPHFFRGRLRNSFRIAMEERHKVVAQSPRDRECGPRRTRREKNSSSGRGGENCWRQPGIPFPLEHRRSSLPRARRNEEAWQPRRGCRRARSHEQGRNWSVRHWAPKTRRR